MSTAVPLRVTPAGQIEWIDAQGGIHRDLDTLPAEAGICLLVPAESVLCRLVETPARTPREIERALPYQLEDELVQDVDQLFFAWQRLRRGLIRVLVAEDAAMDRWLQIPGTPDRVRHLRPDALCLPPVEHGWCVLVEDQRVMVRTAAGCAFAAASTLIPELLERLAERETPDSIRLLHTPDATLPTVAWPVAPQEEEIADPLALLAPQACRDDLPDLRQGRWAPPRNRKLGATGHRLLIAASLLVALGLAARIGLLLHLEQGNAEAREEMVRIFRQAFPEAKRIVNPRVQLRQRLTALRAEAVPRQQNRLTRLLTGLAQAWQPTLRLERLEYREGRLHLQIDAPTIAAVEALTGRLRTAGLSADIHSASSRDKRTLAHLRVEIES